MGTLALPTHLQKNKYKSNHQQREIMLPRISRSKSFLLFLCFLLPPLLGDQFHIPSSSLILVIVSVVAALVEDGSRPVVDDLTSQGLVLLQLPGMFVEIHDSFADTRLFQPALIINFQV